MARVALYDDPVFREHDAGPGHPERPDRLAAVRAGVREADLERHLAPATPRDATVEELLRVHTEAHLALVASTAGRTHQFDPDTRASPRSHAAALRAAGSVAEAVGRVLDGSLQRAFCAVRPPGHHATAERAMGFCLFNNVAVGAAAALARGLSRVAIVDFDVHHGNGTQDLFYEDPRVLYVSTHAYPFYPGTGALGETGEGAGRGFTVNLPLPEGLGDADFVRVYREIVAPILRDFDPEILLVSAGFDAHDGDPLAGMRVTAAGFAEIAAVSLESASGAGRGRAVFVLEGGYLLEGLARSAAAVTAVLLGRSHAPVKGSASPLLEGLLAGYRRTLRPYWDVLGP